jgi:hypothetical protein
MVYYISTVNEGLELASSTGDGYTINLTWNKAYPHSISNKVAYHIYMATEENKVFPEGVKFVSIDGALTADIFELTPGQLYHFAVRAVEYDPIAVDYLGLPTAFDGYTLKVYPESLLRADISSTDEIIPLIDVNDFPLYGIVKIGAELVQYVSVDSFNNNLLVFGSTPPSDSGIIDQGSPPGSFYKPGLSNTGDGYINSLTLVNPLSPTETWTISCVSVFRDTFNQPISGTAKFEAIGSVSGVILDGYGDPIVWNDINQINSNGILSFSIDGYTGFIPGDYFTIKVLGFDTGDTGGRGYLGTTPNAHDTDGYDGYHMYSPFVSFILGKDEQNGRIFPCQSRFEVGTYAFTLTDGYHQVLKDLLTSDMSSTEEANADVPPYDYSGYHRTDPVLLLTGECVGSYFGGQQGCIDGYGNFNIVRGLSLQDQNTQRQEQLLTLTGRSAILLKRTRTGITCDCYLPSSEYADDRCPKCHGTKFVIGYTQFFNPKSSDGRIKVRVGPADEDVKVYEGGLESEQPLDAWTIVTPIIKDRDVIILFDQDDNEEYRYEVITAGRNNTIVGEFGGQKLRLQRIRKTDPIYQVRVFRNTAMFPVTLQTGPGSTTNIPVHSHSIVISEKITMLSQVNQTTGISFGHNHQIVNGVVVPVLGHTHTIILP